MWWVSMRLLVVRKIGQPTMIAYELNSPSVLGNAECMILHTRAAADISQHQNLSCYMSLCSWA